MADPADNKGHQKNDPLGPGSEAPISDIENKNPKISEETRAEFAKHGIFQDEQTGVFYKDSAPMMKDGKPMTEAEVRATLPENAGAPAVAPAAPGAQPAPGGAPA